MSPSRPRSFVHARIHVHLPLQPNPLAGAGEELLQEYAGLETDFLAFFPDALAFAEQVRRAR